MKILTECIFHILLLTQINCVKIEVGIGDVELDKRVPDFILNSAKTYALNVVKNSFGRLKSVEDVGELINTLTQSEAFKSVMKKVPGIAAHVILVLSHKAAEMFADFRANFEPYFYEQGLAHGEFFKQFISFFKVSQILQQVQTQAHSPAYLRFLEQTKRFLNNLFPKGKKAVQSK